MRVKTRQIGKRIAILVPEVVVRELRLRPGMALHVTCDGECVSISADDPRPAVVKAAARRAIPANERQAAAR